MAQTVTHTDKALATRMLRGQQAAFDEFFQAYFPRLYRFALARIGDDEQALKDIVQRTLCRAVRKIELYRGESSLYTWLCRLCLNEISDHLKRSQRQAARDVAFDEVEMQAVLEALDAASTSAAEGEVQRMQLVRLIQTILDHLPVRQGNVLEWKYVQGMTVDEIAARLGVSSQAAQSLLARARQAFRNGFRELVRSDLDGVV